MADQIIQFPFAMGVDEGSNPKALPIGRLKEGVNVRFDKNQRLAKCWGTRALPKTLVANGNVGSAARLLVRDNELCLVVPEMTVSSVTRGYVCAYSPALSKWNRTLVHDLALTWKNFIDDTSGVKSTDTALSGNLIVHAWVTGDATSPDTNGTLFYRIVDATTGSALVDTTGVTSSARACRILVMGGYAFVLLRSATAISYVSINLTTLATGSIATLRNDLNSDMGFDACLVGSTRLVVAYENSSNDIKLYDYSQAAGVLSNVTNGTATEAFTDIGLVSIAHDSSAARLYLLYWAETAGGTSKVRLSIHNDTTLAETVAAQTVEDAVTADQVSVVCSSSDTALVAWSVTVADDDTPPRLSTKFYESDGTSAGGARTSAGLRLCSVPFCMANTPDDTSRWFLVACDANDPQAGGAPYVSSYVVEIEKTTVVATWVPHRYIGKIDDGIAGMPVSGSVPLVLSPSEGRRLVPVFFQATAPQAQVVWRCGLRLLDIGVGENVTPDMWRGVSIGQELYFPAGLLGAFDGRSAFDYGARVPILRSALASASGGAVANGNYVYQITPSYRSFVGVQHRGPVSVQKSTTVSAASAKVTLDIVTHSIDGKQTSQSGFGFGFGAQLLEIYRSLVNGSVPQKLTFEPTYFAVENDPTTPVQSVNDTAADADITGGSPFAVPLAQRPAIYTTGELEEVQPPAPYAICLHQSRVFVATGSRREVWWSKSFDENPNVAPGFHPTQRWDLDEDVTALGSMADKLVIFWERGLWYVVGDGPNPAGEDNRFSTPRAIQSDVGCVNPRSVVGMPGGLMFESARGIYLLSTGLELIDIGDPVRDTLAAFPTITSAVLVASENEVRFTCNDAGGTDGRVIVFDYARKEWLTRDYDTPFADAIMHDGEWTFVTPSGQVYKEDQTTNLASGTTFVPSTVTVAPISLGGPVSWNRVKAAYFIGQSVSNHNLTIAVKKDYETSADQTKTFLAGDSVTTISALEKAMLDLKTQKVQAVEITITDSAPSNTVAYPLGSGGGFIIEGLALRVQPKRGLPREAEARRG